MSVDARVTPTTGLVRPSAASTWRTGAASAAAALAGNAVLLVVARAAGADLLVRRALGEPAQGVGLGAVAVMTLAPVLLATLVLLLVRRWGARAWRALAVVGLVVALVTVPAPFTVLADTSTRVALALMHVVAGVAWFVVVRRAAARWAA